MSGAVAGLYGKHPDQADFVRVGAGDFAQAGLDRWFEEATEALRRERLTLPDAATGFLLGVPGGDQLFAGAFAPSQDAVGRSFPLIVSAAVPARADTSLSALHAACGAFVAEAAALVREAASVPVSEIAARVQTLSVPGPASHSPTQLDHESVQPLLSSVGGSGVALGYALHTCLSACDQAKKPGGAGAAITVDAPAPTDATVRFWLELMTRRLGAVRPSLLWTAGPEGRLLAALGAPPSSFLSYLANPQHRASRFWPLRTEVAAAIDSATKALSPAQRRAVETEQSSLAAVLTAFA